MVGKMKQRKNQVAEKIKEMLSEGDGFYIYGVDLNNIKKKINKISREFS